MPKVAGAGAQASQDLVNLLYKELKQERAARAELQQHVWELEAGVQSQRAAASVDDANRTPAQAAVAAATTASAAVPQSPEAAPASLHSLGADGHYHHAAGPHNAAAATAAEPAANSSRWQLLQELQQAAIVEYWPHAHAATWQHQQHQRWRSGNLHHESQQRQESHRYLQHRQEARDPAAAPHHEHGQQHQRQQQQQEWHSAIPQLQHHHRLQHENGHAHTAAAAQALPRAPAAAAADQLPQVRPRASVVQLQQDAMYNLPYLPPRVATPHIRPSAPALAITPLTNLGCSSSTPCWSAPASCFSNRSSGPPTTAGSSRSGTSAGSAAAAFLSPEATAVLADAAAARDRNSLQLLMESLGSSSSDSEVEGTNSMLLSCNTQRQQNPIRAASAAATAVACDSLNRPEEHHIQYHHDQQQQHQGHPAEPSTFSVHDSAQAAVARTPVGLRSPTLDQEIEIFCSMLDRLNHRDMPTSQPEATGSAARQQQQLHHIGDYVHQPTSTQQLEDCHVALQANMPQCRIPRHHQQQPLSVAAAAHAPQPAGDLATLTEAAWEPFELPENHSGVASRTTAGCPDCAVLQEQLLELEFERELAVAQLAAVVKERDVFALHHRKLLGMAVQQQIQQ